MRLIESEFQMVGPAHANVSAPYVTFLLYDDNVLICHRNVKFLKGTTNDELRKC